MGALQPRQNYRVGSLADFCVAKNETADFLKCWINDSGARTLMFDLVFGMKF